MWFRKKRPVVTYNLNYANFTYAVFFERRWASWFFGGITIFQMSIILFTVGIAVTSINMLQIFVTHPEWQTASFNVFMWFLAALIASVTVCKLIDSKNEELKKTQLQYVKDVIRYHFRKGIHINGKRHRGRKKAYLDKHPPGEVIDFTIVSSHARPKSVEDDFELEAA